VPRAGAPTLRRAAPLARIAWLARWAGAAARDAVVQRYARDLERGAEGRGDLERAAHVLGAFQRRVRFVLDASDARGFDTYQTARETIERGAGDCDDAAPLLAAVFGALGLRARLVGMRSPRQAAHSPYPRHVTTQVWAGGRWLYAEPTLRGAQLGEHPYRAAARLRKGRRDLAS
jgi:transglutaminase-like putative cysteine protease